MAINFGKIMSGIGKGLEIADKVAGAVNKYGGMAANYAKMAPQDWKLPFENKFLQNITGTVANVLGKAEQIVDPFRAELQNIPFVGKFVDKAADFLFDTALPFLQKPVIKSIPFLGKIMPTVDTIVNIAGKIDTILDSVKPHFPVQQGNAANVLAHTHARALEAAN